MPRTKVRGIFISPDRGCVEDQPQRVSTPNALAKPPASFPD